MSRNGLFLIVILYCLLIAVLLLTGCKEEDTAASHQSGQLVVHMTDGPADFSKVNVDIQEVRVHYAEEQNNPGKWVILNTNTGIYNLLDFQNNVSTIIADSTFLTVGHIDEIRLLLGPQNSVEVDKIVYPLMIPSGTQSGIKIKLHADIINDLQTDVLIDFDARLSVHKTGNGNYILSPVVKSERIHYRNKK